MMFRTNGKRSSRDLEGGCSGPNSFVDGVSNTSSQDCPQDVYDFTCPSQDSARCPWSDPYDFGSSQDSRQLEILPPRMSKDRHIGSRILKRAKMIEVQSEPCDSSSFQETSEFGVLEISKEDFQISKKLKKVDFDPFEYNSSDELEGFMVLPQSEDRKYKFSELSKHDNVRKSKKSKNVNSDLCVLDSSQELNDLMALPSSNSDDRREFNRVLGKPKKKEVGENGVLQKEKKTKKKKKKKKMKPPKEPEPSYVELTTTLMETQEFGEMMEHEDEVNFALDGLKKGEPVRIRRASLLSLLSICGSMQQRRLLRVHGMTKTIIDAVLGLSLDDPPSNLASVALFYILLSDGQDDHLLHAPNSIRFLIKLLKPIIPNSAKNKILPIGSKLLGLCKNAGFLQEPAKGTGSSTSAIMLKVRELLVSCKEMKQRDDRVCEMEEPELNPKWISLLTMEKACSSNLTIEDNPGTFRKTGANFKEKLREFGGLDAVFEVARKCHSTIEEWLEKSPTFASDSKDISGRESLELLLKCLKIMENVTFLSKDNQCHLLRMKGNSGCQQATRSFTKLVLSVIKMLSGVSLLRGSMCISHDEKNGGTSDGSSQAELLKSSLEMTQESADHLLVKLRAESSQAGSCSGTSWNSNSRTPMSSYGSEMVFCTEKKQLRCIASKTMDTSPDPFAFHNDDFELSKWDVMSGCLDKPLSEDSRSMMIRCNDGSPCELNDAENHQSQEASCSSIDQDKSNLLSDCLLTAVKVLMNLTNDNPEGCEQIANYGGLEILSSVIAGHFPAFSSSTQLIDDSQDDSLSSKISPRSNQQNATLTDQELDFLVTILGLLVNLVEKDGRNRSRLAATRVSVPILEDSGSEHHSDMISLLCAIFLANQGMGEAPADDIKFSLDEESILQGQKEAEKMIVEAYAALLLAFVSTESKSIRNSIARLLPDHNLKILVPVLERFVEFHMTLNVISPETHTDVLEVIESCRMP